MRWETLNAYVDGELDAQSRHEVAESLARDPVLAARVATLTQLKRGVKAAVVRPGAPRSPAPPSDGPAPRPWPSSSAPVAGDGVPAPGRPRARRLRRLERGGLARE